MEEVGCNVIEIVKKIGIITEYGIAMEGKNNIFKWSTALLPVTLGVF